MTQFKHTLTKFTHTYIFHTLFARYNTVHKCFEAVRLMFTHYDTVHTHFETVHSKFTHFDKVHTHLYIFHML